MWNSGTLERRTKRKPVRSGPDLLSKIEMIDLGAVDLGHTWQTSPKFKFQLRQHRYACSVSAEQNGKNVPKSVTATTSDRMADQTRRDTFATKVRMHVVTKFGCLFERRTTGTIRADRTPTSDLS